MGLCGLSSQVQAARMRRAGEGSTWYADLPPREQIPRCSPSEMWEIEPIVAELRPVLNGSRFVLGGDLNSARVFDVGDRGENARLFDNLHAQGYLDTRPRHSPEEVQT